VDVLDVMSGTCELSNASQDNLAITVRQQHTARNFHGFSQNNAEVVAGLP
jgi:hypothetical protein